MISDAGWALRAQPAYLVEQRISLVQFKPQDGRIEPVPVLNQKERRLTAKKKPEPLEQAQHNVDTLGQIAVKEVS
ncbi:MAG TPA: hypothetical protein VGW38_27290 [Chloroflexota bacterium]|nr:hypothetical protein [Chloroflexota bacterium]